MSLLKRVCSQVLNQDRIHDMEFHVALHTYYAIDNIDNVRVRGLQGLTYEVSVWS
jgi:D-hexose-6-phosphate mutarotase